MNIKRLVAVLMLAALILALVPINVLAQGGFGKGGRPTDPPPTTEPPPTEPPIPTVTPDTGTLYGDLYVILRDEDGLPILRYETLVEPESGENKVVSCIQPISTVTDSITIPTYYGDLTIDAFAGEPFSMASYYDLAGDLVECELTVIMDGDTIISNMTTWVQAVDFGRLNLGRAPDSVIEHAFDEAINKMNMTSQFALDPAGRIMMLIDDEWFTIDAPAENLALYIKMMKDGHWMIAEDTYPTEPGGGNGGGGRGNGGPPDEGDGRTLEERPVLSEDAINRLGTDIGYSNLGDWNNVLNSHDLLLAASLLAASGDKTGTYTLDKVVYINSIYGINQAGTLPDDKGNLYFDFGALDDGMYGQNRDFTYNWRGDTATSDCAPGEFYVLQPFVLAGYDNLYQPDCFRILTKVQFTYPENYEENYHTYVWNSESGVYDVIETWTFNYVDNVRGFVQSADDALQVLEYIHNYKVPVDLYATPTPEPTE